MPSICIPPRAPGGIPRFSAVVPVSSRGLTAGTCTGSHFLPPLSAILRSEEQTTSWRLPLKKSRSRLGPKWPRSMHVCMRHMHVRHTVRARARALLRFSRKLCALPTSFALSLFE